MILDTPGQIEIFTWSASGAIITDAIASAFPAVVAYVIDTPRTAAPATFMSNMLYACSILYKTRLPFILVFNKTDVQRHEFALEWMNDFEVFQAALAGHSATTDSEGEPTYMSSLMNSMSLVLDEFYKNLKVGFVTFFSFVHFCSCSLQAVGVSSLTGDGFKEFIEAVDNSREEYERSAQFVIICIFLRLYYRDYLPELERARVQREKSLQDMKSNSMSKLMKDLAIDRAKNPRTFADKFSLEEGGDGGDDDGDDDDDGNTSIIDRCTFLLRVF